MTAIRRNAVLLALVPAFAACAVRGAGHTTAEIAVGTIQPLVPREAAQGAPPAPKDEKEKTAMESLSFEVYRRGGKYHVTAAMRGLGVDWIEIPDVVPVEPTVESIAAAFRHLEPPIRRALAEAQRGERKWVDEEHWRRMGATSERQFNRSTSSCATLQLSEQTEIWYMLFNPAVGLWTGVAQEVDAKLPPDASYEDIARAVLEIFARYPPPPGDKPAAPKNRRKTAGTEQ